MIGNGNADSFISSLHTLARRYCMDEASRWREIYGRMPQRQIFGDYSEEAYRTFPRYNVLDAILEGVETLDPTNFQDLESLRARLIEAATANNLLTAKPSKAIVRDTMDEERSKFVAYVASIREDQLGEVEPLFFRRKLRGDEVATFRDLLAKRWQTDLSYWYPLSEKPVGIDIEAFHVSIFARDLGYDHLREILTRHGVTRIFEIQEGGTHGYEIGADGLEPTYGSAGLGFSEIWWTDKNASFIIYASHESSITLGGWVLDDMRVAWPSWRSLIYTGWDQA